jgi:hypothetical protein
VAEEGTAERVPPEFFRDHSVAELSKQSDYWLGKRGRLTHPMLGGGPIMRLPSTRRTSRPLPPAGEACASS